METLLDILRDTARRGVTLGRKAIKVGRATIEIVVKVMLAK